MQFLVVAHDGTDSMALERRLAARPAHLDLGRKLRAEGRHLYGVAMLETQLPVPIEKFLVSVKQDMEGGGK